MENDDFKLRWEKNKHKILHDYPQLTDKDLTGDTGKAEELLERLQILTGKTKKEIYDWLDMMG
ncbi:hypothetical protein ACTHGU_07340 [Chitinophagaceae bacterium MMS25-I14]